MGLLEVLPALLLLFRKTRFVGSVIMFPVVLNVLVTNVFNRISPFTLFSVSLLTIFNIFIIYSYKNEIRELIRKINSSPIPVSINSSWRRSITAMKVLLFGFIVYSIGSSAINYLHIKDKAYFGTGAYQLTGLKINDKPIKPDSIPATWFKKIYKESDLRFTKVVNGNDKEESANVLFNKNKDSIKIAFVHWGDNDNRMEDSNSVFKGVYKFKADTELVINGNQNGNYIVANYRKLPFKDYRWWW
jgi:hypothetical protein